MLKFQIADIMSSFGGNLTSFESPSHLPHEQEYNFAFEAYMDKLLTRRETGIPPSLGWSLRVACGIDIIPITLCMCQYLITGHCTLTPTSNPLLALFSHRHRHTSVLSDHGVSAR